MSTHPGAGKDGFSAAGEYQMTIGTWRGLTRTLGLSDFSPGTQDLMGVQLLRESGASGSLLNNDLPGALSAASHTWAALPQGPGLGTRYPPQPYMTFDNFKTNFDEAVK